MGLLDAIGSAVGGIAGIASSWIQSKSNKQVANINYDAQKETNESNERNVAATNQANKDIAAANNQANFELWQAQNAEDWKRWQAENEYNDPSAQASRLAAAGINPSSALGGSVSPSSFGGSTAPPPSESAQMEAPQSVAPRMEQTPDVMASVLNKLSSTPYALAQLLEQNATAQSKMVQADIDKQVMPSKVQEAIAQSERVVNDSHASFWQKLMAKTQSEYYKDLMDAQLKGQQVNTRLMDAQIKNVEEQTLNLAVERSLNDFQLQCQKQRLPLEIDQLRLGLKHILSSIALQEAQSIYTRGLNGLTDAQIEHYAAQSAKTWLEANGVADSNERANQLAPYIVNQYKNNAELVQSNTELNQFKLEDYKHGWLNRKLIGLFGYESYYDYKHRDKSRQDALGNTYRW